MSACSDIAPLPTSFLIRSRSRHPRRWGILLETNDGTVLRMRAIGQNEMRQLLSTLMVHCLKAPSMEARHAPARSYIAPRQNASLPLSVPRALSGEEARVRDDDDARQNRLAL